MDNKCLICRAVPSLPSSRAISFFHDPDCSQCPLGDGSADGAPCTLDETFITEGYRGFSSRVRRLARGNRLIEILDEHGITIYDVKIK